MLTLPICQLDLNHWVSWFRNIGILADLTRHNLTDSDMILTHSADPIQLLVN
jgi:uncharacterized membrane protein